MGVGLLRSSLLKSKSRDVAFAVTPDPFALAPTVPAMAPLSLAPAADEAPNTIRDGVEVHVETPARAPFNSAPSTSDLLERAAALGPARMTWESIVLPNDPILHEKSTPHVAERRARLTRLVKGALGACVAVCVLALGVTAISGSSSEAPAANASAAAKTIPSKVVVPIETLSIARHGKAPAPSMIVAQARPAPAPFVAPVRGKRR